MNIEARGGLCVKHNSQYYAGMPDRLVFMPDGKFFMVELKSSKGRLSAIQRVVHKKLKERGHKVFTISNKKELEDFLNGL